MDHPADHGRDGGLTGGGRHRGGPVVGSPDVVQPDGARDFKHGVDVPFVVGAAGSDDDVRHHHVVRLLLGDAAGFLGRVDGGQEPWFGVAASGEQDTASVKREFVHGNVQDVQPGAVFEIAAVQGRHVRLEGRHVGV